ncbi:MAG: T9SS type A sorting domain-containing protein, partial [Chitinophagales bacterium]|nr:T9SS type A sorting domain-containing protein [Chitinophagales bacterium]
MKHLLLFAMLSLLYSELAISQSISPEVVASCGRSVTAPSLQLSYTVGEPVITTLTASSTIITQGFHQSYKNTSVHLSDNMSALALKVYPNPTSNRLFILSSGYDKPVRIRLSHLSGAIMYENRYTSTTSIEIDLSLFSDGMYI